MALLERRLRHGNYAGTEWYGAAAWMNGYLALAEAVLALHLGVILFNLFGFIAIPLGAWRRWGFVRGFYWRALHVVIMLVVALQAIAGRACILTLWQDALSGLSLNHTPLVMRWVNAVIFWPLPLWVFGLVYIALFLYVLALLWLVPPLWPRRFQSGAKKIG